MDPLFAYLDGLDGGWSALTGDVLAAGAAGVPTNVAIRSDADNIDNIGLPPTQSSNQWIPVGVGATVVATIAIIAAALWSRRRRTTGTGGEPATEPQRTA